MKTIGNKIKELRRSKGMSQKDIADKLGSYQSGGKQMGE
jgi:transcriptional regulator with XRE-family HTH domain